MEEIKQGDSTSPIKNFLILTNNCQVEMFGLLGCGGNITLIQPIVSFLYICYFQNPIVTPFMMNRPKSVHDNEF